MYMYCTCITTLCSSFLHQALGQAGRVVKIRANSDIRVAVNGSRWVFNPKCLTPAPGEVPIEEQTGQP